MSPQPQLVTLRPAPVSEPPAKALSEPADAAPIIANVPEPICSAAHGHAPAADAATEQIPTDRAAVDRSAMTAKAPDPPPMGTTTDRARLHAAATDRSLTDTATIGRSAMSSTTSRWPTDTAAEEPSSTALRGADGGHLGPAPMTQGALALNFQVAPGIPAVPAIPAPPALRLVGPNEPADALPDAVPDIYNWAPRLVQAVAEVIAGDRPIGQLIRWTDSDVYADLHRRVRVLGLTTTATARGSEGRAVVRSVHVCYPRPEVAEIAAHVRHGGRSRAVAMRLEVHRDRWVCTALRLG